jgi:hypothetical protein
MKESVISKVISKSDWDKSIASFEVAKATKESVILV